MNQHLHTINGRDFVVVPLTFGTSYVPVDLIKDFLYEPKYRLDDGTTTERLKVAYGDGQWVAAQGQNAVRLHLWLTAH
jgi:hypothetical protein